MKSSLGKTLRKIRQGKNVTLTAIADENLSKSQISRFERGESEISCIRLINILNKLNVTLDEFLILYSNNEKEDTNFINLVNYIREAYSKQDIATLKKLLTNSTKFHLNSFEKTMVKSILHTLDNSIMPLKEEILNLTDYLFKIEMWGYYEIILLGNCAQTIDYPSLILLTKEMLKNYIYSSLNRNNKKFVTQLAINCLLSSIEQEKFGDCNFLMLNIEKLLKNELNYYEQTVFLYAKGYYEFKKKIPSGRKKMEQAIQIFKILDDKCMITNYSEHYSKILKHNK